MLKRLIRKKIFFFDRTLKVLIIAILFFNIVTNGDDIQGETKEKQIFVVFMYDDYSNKSPIDTEVKLIEALKSTKVVCTFVVVPYVCVGEWHDSSPQPVMPLNPAKINLLHDAFEAGVLEVGQHGYSHQALSKKNKDGYTEFSGVDYQVQLSKIAKGKRFLEEGLGTKITTFIPTWNSYDLNTLNVLQELEFKSISAMEYGPSIKNSALRFLPVTCDLYSLKDAVNSARRIPDDQSVIVVLFGSRDLRSEKKDGGDLGFQNFISLLTWISNQKDIQVRSTDQIVKEMNGLDSFQFSKYNSYLRLSRFLYPLIPQRLRSHLFPVGVYLSNKSANQLRISLLLFMFFFFLGGFVIAYGSFYLGGRIIFPRSKFILFICKYGGPALVILLSLYIFVRLDFSYNKLILEISQYQYRSYYRPLMALVISLGASIGVWKCFLKLRK